MFLTDCVGPELDVIKGPSEQVNPGNTCVHA
jgi:hypothetical protein